MIEVFYLILITMWLITAYFQIRTLINIVYIRRMRKKEQALLIHVLEQKSKVTDNKDGTYTHTFE